MPTLLPCLFRFCRFVVDGICSRLGAVGSSWADGSVVVHTWMKSHVIAGKRCQALFAQRMMRLAGLMALLRYVTRQCAAISRPEIVRGVMAMCRVRSPAAQGTGPVLVHSSTRS